MRLVGDVSKFSGARSEQGAVIKVGGTGFGPNGTLIRLKEYFPGSVTNGF